MLMATVSTQLTSLTVAREHFEVTIDQIELEDSVQFTNLRALSMAVPLSLEGLASFLSRCPMLEFLAIELTQECMRDLSPLLRQLQSLTQLHLHITELEEEINEEAVDLFSEVTLPEVRKFSMVVDSQGRSIFIKGLPHMSQLTEFVLHGVMLPSQALASTINHTQILRHLRLENVESSDHDDNHVVVLRKQPLLFLSLTDCTLPETFRMLAHWAQTTLQWLNIMSEFLVTPESKADDGDLTGDGTGLFPKLRLIRIEQDIGPMSPATIVFEKNGSLINGHLLPESVHVEDESEEDESSLISEPNFCGVEKPSSAHHTVRRVFVEMPYPKGDPKTILNSTRLYRQRCFVNQKIYPKKDQILFSEKRPVLDETYQVTLHETPLPEKIIVSMVKWLEKNSPMKDWVFSLGVVECTLQKKEAIRLTQRGESDQVVAISFAGSMVGTKDVSIVRAGDFWYVKLRKDSKLDQKTGYLSYVLQSRWHEIRPVKKITLDFLWDLINGKTEAVNFFPGLEPILAEINALSKRFLSGNGEALYDEVYEQLTNIELLKFSRKTGLGSCLQRAQAGMDHLQGKIEQYSLETFVQIRMIQSDEHAYPVLRIAYKKPDREIAWISLPLEWGGIEFAGGMTVLEVPTQQTTVASQKKPEFTGDTKLFPRAKLTRRPAQDVVTYATEQLMSHANFSSNPPLLIFNKATDIAYFVLLMRAIAQQQDIAMYSVMTLDELQCVASGLVQSPSNENVLVYQQNYKTRLHEFFQEAQENPGKNYSLVINWLGVSLDDPGARANYNSVLEHNRRDRRIGGVELPPNVQPLSLDGAQALFDPSFLRRHLPAQSFPCDSQEVKTALAERFGIDSIERRNASLATIDTTAVKHIVELRGSESDWRSILLGCPYLDHRSGEFKLKFPLLQNDGDEKAVPLVLSNPPLHDFNFIFFIMRAQIEGVHALGRYYPPDCFKRLQWSSQVTRHWESLLATGVEFYQTAPADADFLPLSSTFSGAFIQRVVIGESWEEGPVRTKAGLLERYKGQTVTLYVIEAVSSLVWFQLLRTAKEHKVFLRIHAQPTNLPDEMQTYLQREDRSERMSDSFSQIEDKTSFVKDDFERLFPAGRCHYSLVSSEQLSAVVERYKQQRGAPSEDIIVDGQDLTRSDVCYRFGKPAITAGGIYIERTYSDVWQALIDGQTVLIKGNLSVELCQWLDEVYRYQQRGLWNGSDWVKWPYGHLHVLTTSSAGFSPDLIAHGFSKPLDEDVEMESTPSVSSCGSDTEMDVMPPSSSHGEDKDTKARQPSTVTIGLFAGGKGLKRPSDRDASSLLAKRARVSVAPLIQEIYRHGPSAFFLWIDSPVSFGVTSTPSRLKKALGAQVFDDSQIQEWAKANLEPGKRVYLYLKEMPTGQFKVLGEQGEQFCWQGKLFNLSPHHRVIIQSEKPLSFPNWLSREKVASISLPTMAMERILKHHLTALVVSHNEQSEPTEGVEQEMVNGFFQKLAKLAITKKPFAQALLHEKVLQRILCAYLAREDASDGLLLFADQLAGKVLDVEDYQDFQTACREIFPQDYQPEAFLSKYQNRAERLLKEQQMLQQDAKETFGFVKECSQALSGLEEMLRLCQWQRTHPGASLFKPAQIIIGDTSVGKSSLVRNYLRNSGYHEIGYRELLSSTSEIDATKVFCQIPAGLDLATKKKILMRAFHAGIVCVLDEFTAKGLDDFVYMMLSGYDADEQVAKRDGFGLIGTCNPKGYGNDRERLPRFLRRFFASCDYYPYSKESIKEIITLHGYVLTDSLDEAVESFVNESEEEMAFGNPPIAFSRLLTLASELSTPESNSSSVSPMGLDEDVTQEEKLSKGEHASPSAQPEETSSKPKQEKKNRENSADFHLVNTDLVVGPSRTSFRNYLGEAIQQWQQQRLWQQQYLQQQQQSSNDSSSSSSSSPGMNHG